MNTKIVVTGTLAAGLVAATMVLFLAFRPGSAAAQDVEVREEGAVVSVGQAADAIATVSARVGFDVKVPTFVPDSLKLVSVDSTLGPEGAPNALRLAFLSYGPRDAAMQGKVAVRIEEAGLRFAAPDERAQKVDLGVAGVDAYVQVTDRATGYWAFTSNRGFLVTVTGPQAPADDQIRKMLASLVRE